MLSKVNQITFFPVFHKNHIHCKVTTLSMENMNGRLMRHMEKGERSLRKERGRFTDARWILRFEL